MPDILFPSHCKVMSGIFQIYTTHILSKSFGNMPGIYLDYSSACKLACSSNAIGMQLLSQITDFGCQGCLIFSAKRGVHACQRQSVSRCSPMWSRIDCDASGILYTWYKAVQGGMYWYKPVCTLLYTRPYEKPQNGTYQYVPT
jgi:hypothetical protein